MSDLYQVAESFPIWKAILWCFYPMAALVLIELFLRAIDGNDDDDDTNGGKGMRVQQLQPVTVPSGA